MWLNGLKYFENTQVWCGIKELLKIPLHSNIWWGSAHAMLDRAYKLHQVSKTSTMFSYWFLSYQAIGLFFSSADEAYGPMTTIHHDGWICKHIPWSAFKLLDSNWQKVLDVKNILEVCRVCFLMLLQYTIDGTVRTQTTYSNIFLWRNYLRSGVVLPWLA